MKAVGSLLSMPQKLGEARPERFLYLPLEMKEALLRAPISNTLSHWLMEALRPDANLP